MNTEIFIIRTDIFNTALMTVLFDRRIKRDEVTKNVLFPAVMKQGCKPYPTLSDMKRKADMLYGGLLDAGAVKKGNHQLIQFLFRGLNNAECIYEGAKFLRDTICEPLVQSNAFISETVKAEKQNRKYQIEALFDNKSQYALQRCLEEMSRRNSDLESIGINPDGYTEYLDKIDETNLYRHYSDILSDTTARIICIGDIDGERMSEIFNNGSIVKSLSFGNSCDKNTEKSKATSEPEEITERRELSQAKLCIGYRCDLSPESDDYFALTVFNEVLGAGPNSRLFTEVREKNSLCYHVSSLVYRLKPVLMIQAGIDEKDLKKAVELIDAEILKLCKDEIDTKTLANAKQTLQNRYIQIKDKPSSLAEFHVGQALLGKPSTPEDVIELIDRITPSDVQRAAKSINKDTVYLLA